MRPYQPSEFPSEYHAVVSIELGELIEDGFIDWNDESWTWDYYNEAQYKRLCTKIENHFWHREIGIIPPGHWKMEFMRLMNEIMPKYKLAYQALDSGIDWLQTGDSYGKSRNVFSDFPATQLKSSVQDYASNATDHNHEDITQGDWMDKLAALKNYNDVDKMIIDELETLFSSLFTVNINM